MREQRVAGPPDELCARVGDSIKSIRKKAGLTQKGLADRLGISQQIVSRVERGQGNITLLTLKEIAAALGCKADIRLTE